MKNKIMNKNNVVKGVVISAVILFISACSSMTSQDSASNEELKESEAVYEITIHSTWSVNTHPEEFPSNPHFSRLVLANHKADYSFWSEGKMASKGVKEVAETGAVNILINEINEAKQQGHSKSPVIGGSISTSPSQSSYELNVYPDYPAVSLISMLAPSPDWFIGIDSIVLYEDGKWKESVELNLYVYDAGTDAGLGYTSANQVESPAKNIQKIVNSPINGVSIGTIVIKKV